MKKMKKLLSLSVILIISVVCGNVRGQITSLKTKIDVEQSDELTVYDSTINFMEFNPKLYIGQTVYLVGKSESLRKYGYRGFFKPKKKKLDFSKFSSLHTENIYYWDGKYNSLYDKLNSKHFEVLDVLNHKNNYKYWLKLREQESGDILYYEYSGKSKSSFPFLVVGFFEKQKELVGKKYVFTKLGLRNSKDLKTGKKLIESDGNFLMTNKWTIKDVTIEDSYYYLVVVVENDSSLKTTVNLSDLSKECYAYTPERVEFYEKKFNKANFYLILKRQVRIGMTILSWGEPEDINKTILSGNVKHEQWMYSLSSYLYFEGNILTTIQN